MCGGFGKRLRPYLDDFVQPGFINRQLVAVPGVDAGLGNIHNRDFDVRALLRDHGHGGAAHVPGADAANCCREGRYRGCGLVFMRLLKGGCVGEKHRKKRQILEKSFFSQNKPRVFEPRCEERLDANHMGLERRT